MTTQGINLSRQCWYEHHVNNCGCGTLFAFAAVVAFLFSFLSCATKHTVEYRDVNHYITREAHDTLRETAYDSIYLEVKSMGDTVFLTKFVKKIEWKERTVVKHDTIFMESKEKKQEVKVKEVVNYPKLFVFAVLLSLIILATLYFTKKTTRWLH